MPPGPPTIPVLGNAFDVPRELLHVQFAEWSKLYGDVFSLVVFDKKYIVLNSATLVRDVIDRQSSSSSNRPKSILADIIAPDNVNMGMAVHADATWKTMRKACAQLLNKDSLNKLAEYQKAEATQLMWEFAHEPDNWFHHFKRFITSFLMGTMYGSRGPTLSSPSVKDFLYVHPMFTHALDFRTLPPVDIFPILTWVPERWAKWKTIVNEIKFLHETLFETLLMRVEKRLDNGRAIGGVFMEEMLEAGSMGLSREHLMHIGGVLLEGSDLCSATLQTAVYCLVNHPDVLERAQDEMDLVVGCSRVPSWDDFPRLKYLQAFIEEVQRFRPIAPLGLPHAMSRDEYINGVLYPKDSVVICNTWAMLQDERYFDRPDMFMPERFVKHPLGMKDGITGDPAYRSNLAFGGGRRVCPGIAMAKTSLEICLANLVWGFDFAPALNSQGLEVPPCLDDHNKGVAAIPNEHPIRIKVRSQQHQALIDKEFSAAGGILSRYELEIADEDKLFNCKYRDSP